MPIRSRRDGPAHVRINTYYIRRPGPSSDAPRTGREWDELIGRCIRIKREELLDDLRRILEGRGLGATPPEPTTEDRLDEWAAESRERWEQLVREHPRDDAREVYKHGTYDFAYLLDGDIRGLSAREMLNVIQRSQGRETGWPEWLVVSGGEFEPRRVEGGMIEAFFIENMFGDPSHADYWRASPDVRLYLLRGYEEDSPTDQWQPGTVFDFTLPIWRAGEALLHASRVAREVGAENATVHFRANWRSLEGRTLRSLWASRRWVERRLCHTDSVVSYVHVPADEIADGLPEIVHGLLAPLYEVFEFFELGVQVIEEELAQMRRRG